MKSKDQQLLEEAYREVAPPHATAETYAPIAYEEAISALESSMEKVHAAIEQHKQKAANQPMNRGYVGDIKRVQEMLNDILAFLS